MLTRYPIVMAAAAVALAITGRRLWYLQRLIRSGERARPDRPLAPARQPRRRGRRPAELLRWTVPGLAHAFTFWGFTVLILTIIEAYGDLFQQNFAIPGIGHSAFVGFVEDFFACAVLVALVRVQRHPPPRLARNATSAPRAFTARTPATAWVTLGMIALVIITLLVYRAAQTNTGDFPYGWWAFASHGLGRALHPLGLGGQPHDRDGLRRPEHRRDHVVPGASSCTPSTFTSSWHR